MYYKEEIKITDDDKLIIEKLGELLSLTAIDDYFYTHDQEFFVQLGLFTNTEFEEAYTKGFGRFFSDKYFYRWVRTNVIKAFTALLQQVLFEGLLEQFNENEDGVLTYKNCWAFRTHNIITQTEQQAEETQEVNSKILTLQEAHLYEKTGMLEIEDNLNVIQVMPCYCIRVQQEKVDENVRKELIKEIRTLIYKRMCTLLQANFERANCVEALQYRLMLGLLIGVIDKGFEPQFKKEGYERFEVAKNVTVDLQSEFKYFKALYVDFRHYKKSLIRL